MPSRSDTVIVGNKSFESLVAEFGNLSLPAPDLPPPGTASVKDLAKVWGLSNCHTRVKIAKLVGAGVLKEVGRYRVPKTSGGTYPVMHYTKA
jgi:hypothetical protein